MSYQSKYLEDIKLKAKEARKLNKPSKLKVAVALWNEGFCEREIAAEMEQMDMRGELIIKRVSDTERNYEWYLTRTREALSRAAKQGLIDREYMSREDRNRNRHEVYVDHTENEVIGMGPVDEIE